jgi:tRNA pseudouridine55 synthase
MVDGILNVDKPTGWTSHDVVAFIRRKLDVRRVGHAGTLDPFATGVLLICVGHATRVAEYLTASDKTYHAVAELGVTTDTYDIDGSVKSHAPIPSLSEDDVQRALAVFQGEIEQVPPAYSAVKRGGVPAYRRARRGEQVELPSRTVRIHEIRLLEWRSPHLEFIVTCDAGTYIRSIAHDLGAQLGCGATLVALTRTRSGPFRIEDAVTPDTLAENTASGGVDAYLHPIRDALYSLLPVPVTEIETMRLAQGQAIDAAEILPSPARSHSGTIFYALGPDEQVRAIIQYDETNRLWRPVKVFASHSKMMQLRSMESYLRFPKEPPPSPRF